MPLELDSRVGEERRQFATEEPPEFCQLLLDAGMTRTDSKDFYEGLMSGYAKSLQMIQQMTTEHAQVVIGSCIAHLAKRLS